TLAGAGPAGALARAHGTAGNAHIAASDRVGRQVAGTRRRTHRSPWRPWLPGGASPGAVRLPIAGAHRGRAIVPDIGRVDVIVSIHIDIDIAAAPAGRSPTPQSADDADADPKGEPRGQGPTERIRRCIDGRIGRVWPRSV